MAIMDLIWALIGHFEGTNIGYMGIYCHICIRIVPPLFVGGFMGAKPPECPTSPPYKVRIRVVNPRVRTRGWVGYGYDPGQKIGEWVHGFIPMTHPPLHG